MAIRRLRVYTEPELERTEFATVEEQTLDTVRVPLSEILPLLADAVASQRTWLNDFADDEVTISSDLHDVLQAYRHFRRPGA